MLIEDCWAARREDRASWNPGPFISFVKMGGNGDARVDARDISAPAVRKKSFSSSSAKRWSSAAVPGIWKEKEVFKFSEKVSVSGMCLELSSLPLPEISAMETSLGVRWPTYALNVSRDEKVER